MNEKTSNPSSWIKWVKTFFAVIGIFCTILFAVTAFISDLCDIHLFENSRLCYQPPLPLSEPSGPCDGESTTKKCAISLFASKETDPNIPPQLRMETLQEVQEGGSTDFRLGSRMKIRFNSNHNGYVFLFNINPDGNLITFFPNQYSEIQQAYLKAGKELVIPDVFWDFDFPVDKPTGEATLVAILVEDDEDDDLAIGYNALPLVSKDIPTQHAKSLLQILHLQLEALTVDDEKGDNRPVQWFSNVANYKIMH